MKKQNKKPKVKAVKSSKNKGKFYLKIAAILILISVISLTFNLDRFGGIIPNRYKPIFEKLNDLIFGKVQVIEIYGNNIISKDEILTHIYKEEVSKDDLILINPSNKIIKSISQNPLIESVNVKRFLPNRMVVYIKEKTLVLRFYNEKAKKFFTISDAGKVIDYYNPNLKIPLIIRSFDTKDTLSIYNKIKKYPTIFNSLTDIIPFFEYRFDIVLNRKILVNLPEDNTNEALSILENLIKENKILEKKVKQIDFRVKGKIFIDYFKRNEMEIFQLEDSITVLTFKDK